MAIERIQFDTYNRPILMMIGAWMEADYAKVNLRPDYQRESVWTLDQRVNLIKSFMQGLPVGVLFLNRPDNSTLAAQNVVDGKQRIETLMMWMRGEFAVPREWFDPQDVVEGLTHAAVCWDELTERGKRRCDFHWGMSVYETKLPASAEPELYERINYGGTPHEPLVKH